jgi:hypothetical protein
MKKVRCRRNLNGRFKVVGGWPDMPGSESLSPLYIQYWIIFIFIFIFLVCLFKFSIKTVGSGPTCQSLFSTAKKVTKNAAN